jgi:hypothetical protein
MLREEPMEACRICQKIDHTTSDCKSLSQFLNVLEEQVCAFNQYGQIILHIRTIITQI